jgi:hypothetical protein
MEMTDNSDHVFSMAKATVTARVLNEDSDGFTYEVVPLPNGMAKVAVYDEMDLRAHSCRMRRFHCARKPESIPSTEL